MNNPDQNYDIFQGIPYHLLPENERNRTPLPGGPEENQGGGEPFFEFVADGAVYTVDIVFRMRALLVQNFSNVPWTLKFDSGAIYPVYSGGYTVLYPPFSQHLTAQSTAVGTGTLVCIPFETRGGIFYAGQNQSPAPLVPNEHIGNGTVSNTVASLVIARPTRVSLTIVNESTVALRAGNTADGISATVGLYVPPNGGSVTFIGGEAMDICAVSAGTNAYSFVDAYL